MRLLVCFMCAISVPVAADERAPFLGTWGTKAQCAGDPVIEGGSKLAAPFEITQAWMRNGETWCALRWFPVQRGVFASTRALCGEDSQVTYRLDMVLDGASLSLVWDEALANGPLMRCAAQGS